MKTYQEVMKILRDQDTGKNNSYILSVGDYTVYLNNYPPFNNAARVAMGIHYYPFRGKPVIWQQ